MHHHVGLAVRKSAIFRASLSFNVSDGRERKDNARKAEPARHTSPYSTKSEFASSDVRGVNRAPIRIQKQSQNHLRALVLSTKEC
jgi:hypothetical protein